MTTVTAGQPATLVSEWRQYGGGPLVDLDAPPAVTIIPAAGGTPVYGPDASEVAHPATGIYTLVWQPPASTAAGDYLVIWEGQYQGDIRQATELATVAAPVGTGTTGAVPCPGSWTPAWCCKLPDPADYPDLDIPEIIEQQTAAAAEILYNLSGQRFGLCQLTLRPCRRECWGGSWGEGWWEWSAAGGLWPRPALIDGAWFNLACGSCLGSCSCRPLSEAILPGIVYSVDQVKLDGEVLVKNVDYRLDNARRLVRLGGSWPVCQRMDLDDDQPGTWSVTATWGEPLPVSGQLALGELACELINACIGADCKLPQPVQQLVRQGVTVSFLDPNEVYAAGRIGLTKVDLFLQWANPERLQSPPAVFDVDAPTWRRTNTG